MSKVAAGAPPTNGDAATQPEPQKERDRWPARLLAGSARMADTLNENFVALARRADDLVNKAERAVLQRVSRVSPEEMGDGTDSEEADQLGRWVRVRLSELHLRVGQSLYDLEDSPQQSEATPDTVRHQLLALLREIERLEEILRRVGDPTTTHLVGPEVEEVGNLLAQLEIEGETERS